MVSKRKFIIMGIMMFVLLFLFQFSQVMKEDGNQYDINDHVTSVELSEDDQWEQAQEVEVAQENSANGTILFVGGEAGELGQMVKQAGNYLKCPVFCVENVLDWTENYLDTVIVMEGDALNPETDLEWLKEYVSLGGTIIFGTLPQSSVIEEYPSLAELLDITKVQSTNVELSGINLFEGFLLGGQSIYQAKSEKEKEEKQDLDLQVPWYLTGNRSHAFMVGMLEDEKVKNERLPAIIWRSSLGSGQLYAVNGSYMKEGMGIGFLCAMLADAKDYFVYPVVNSQGLAIANYPSFAKENGEKIADLYSRDMVAFFRDIIWPSLWSTAEKMNSPLTCYLAPQFDYEDDAYPEKDLLTFYLKQMKEQNSEAGLTTDFVSRNSLEEKWQEDQEYFAGENCKYDFAALYVPAKQQDKMRRALSRGIIQVKTVTSEYREGDIVSYFNEDTTLQRATSIGISHTFREDLRMKSFETALGYANILFDMEQIAFPAEKDERWEVLSDRFSSNINTYWKPFAMFDKTTASECDTRIRRFLATDYSQSREGDVISLDVKEKDTYFILRTHKEEIDSMVGGQFTKIERGAYLLHLEEENVTLNMKKEDELKYQLP